MTTKRTVHSEQTQKSRGFILLRPFGYIAAKIKEHDEKLERKERLEIRELLRKGEVKTVTLQITRERWLSLAVAKLLEDRNSVVRLNAVAVLNEVADFCYVQANQITLAVLKRLENRRELREIRKALAELLPKIAVVGLNWTNRTLEPGNIPKILELLKKEQWDIVRGELIRALHHLAEKGHVKEIQVSALSHEIKGNSFSVRYQATELFSLLSENGIDISPVTDDLLKLATHPSRSIFGNKLFNVIRGQPVPVEKILPLLRTAIDAKDNELLASTAGLLLNAIERNEDISAIEPILLEILDMKDEQGKDYAIFTEKDYGTAANGLVAVAAMRDNATCELIVNWLAEKLDDKNFHVQDSAFGMLYTINGHRKREDRTFPSPDHLDKYVNSLAERLRNDDVNKALWAFNKLCEISHRHDLHALTKEHLQRYVNAIGACLNSGDLNSRWRALEILHKISQEYPDQTRAIITGQIMQFMNSRTFMKEVNSNGYNYERMIRTIHVIMANIKAAFDKEDAHEATG